MLEALDGQGGQSIFHYGGSMDRCIVLLKKPLLLCDHWSLGFKILQEQTQDLYNTGSADAGTL